MRASEKYQRQLVHEHMCNGILEEEKKEKSKEKLFKKMTINISKIF